ncbi:DUF6573 family protein [Paraburkholderia sp. SIMBA_049]
MYVYYYDVGTPAAPSPARPIASREQRLANGSLQDVSMIASDAGFSAPVAISKEALRVCLTGLQDLAPGQCLPWPAARRLRSILHCAAAEAMHHHEDKQVFFHVQLDRDDGDSAPAFEVHLKLVIDAGTGDRAVVTILLPDQD